MHGRIKVRTTEEQKLIKQKEQQKKLIAYRMGMEQILSSRQKDNYNPESLITCAKILNANPHIYTLWNYRKEVILMEIEKSKLEESGDKQELQNFLENELTLTEQCLLSSPKCYGSWHHRYWVLEHHPNPNWKKEFQLCTQYLSVDDRNFHCWDYRRQIINKTGISLEDELLFSKDRLNENFSNYSSWHYRSTLLKLDAKRLDTELTLVQNAVFTDPFDTSAWFYLRWVLSHDDIPQERRQKLLDSLNELQEIEPDCKWIVVAKCWLKGTLCLNDSSQIDNRIECYQDLIKMDPLREGQYKDYLKHSKFDDSCK